MAPPEWIEVVNNVTGEDASEFPATHKRDRVLICSKTGETCINECGDHANRAPDPAPTHLTAAHQAIIRETLAMHIHVTPVRIRQAMRRKLQVSQDLLPPLAKDIQTIIHEHAYTGSEPETAPFTFSFNYGDDDRIFSWFRRDTTSRDYQTIAERRLNRPPELFIFHLDAAYKANQLGYPVIVCGCLDRCRTFHVVALFVMSQQKEPQYFDALSAL
ncbi:LOW QUALITY PROTEIN: hypothetical protein PHPALM_30523 [Phytophthora palmivora]|uniref:MULE transposase domain-containing protein n=1 Tax=Phytophthora palmivora TaxID=4796 RepID=A0A2P4X4Y1_9STRA|nr:LOW QUALITY PROTEIN: hypothetical protein PHPALM_30523 [Phytophthora palmivora]